MLDFTCPSCKAHHQVPDSYAGKSVICPECAKPAMVPRRDETQTGVTTPDIAEAAQQAKSHHISDEVDRDTFSIAKDGGAKRVCIRHTVSILVGVAIVSILIAMLVPPIRRVGDAAARTQSANNIKQLVLGMHSFNEANKRFPCNGNRPAVAFADDPTSGSWAIQILFYIEQAPQFANPENAKKISISTYMCPGRARSTNVETGPVTDYFLNIYLNTRTIGNGWNAVDSGMTFKELNDGDGSSHTVFIGQGWISEKDYGKTVIPGQSNSIFLGGIPDLARGGPDIVGVGTGPNVVLQRDSDALPAGANFIPWGGPYKQGALMGMGDGTVRMFPYQMSGPAFGAFLTPSNRDQSDLPDT